MPDRLVSSSEAGELLEGASEDIGAWDFEMGFSAADAALFRRSRALAYTVGVLYERIEAAAVERERVITEAADALDAYERKRGVAEGVVKPMLALLQKLAAGTDLIGGCSCAACSAAELLASFGPSEVAYIKEVRG